MEDRPFHFNPVGHRNLLYGPVRARSNGSSVFYRVRRRLRDRLGLHDLGRLTVLPPEEDHGRCRPGQFELLMARLPREPMPVPGLSLPLPVADERPDTGDFEARFHDHVARAS